MALTLTQLIGNSSTVTLNVGEGTANVEYFPGKVTEKTFAQAAAFGNLTDVASVEAGFASLNEMLVSLIKDWDLFEDDAETVKIPVTVERLASIPYTFRVALISAIMGDIRPN